MMAIAARIAGACLAFGAACAGASAQTGDPVSFAGKQIQFLIGTGAGDTYDSYARLLGKYLTKHLPGSPVVVPSNRAGAGSLVAVNATYNSQVRDGSMLVMGQRFVPLMPLLGLPGAQFDPTKMAYIGSVSSETSVCVAHERSGVATVVDAKKSPLIVGTMGAGTELTNFTATIHRMLGIEFQVVRGYGSSGEIDLAIDRGELQGRCGVSYSSLMRTRGDWVKSGKVKIFLQIDVERSRDMPNTPALGELVNEVDRAALRLLTAPGVIARPVFGPPDMPPERLAALRKAFDDAMVDKEFLEEARRQQLEVAPMGGAAMERLIRDLYASDPKVIARARELANSTTQ
jgi:tripartite-type tricarboxylate transporter receptor subunit TctC